MLVANFVNTDSSLSTGALPDSQGEQEIGKAKKVLKIKVGAIERIPKELKHLDTSKHVSKHKFPQDRLEKKLCLLGARALAHSQVVVHTDGHQGWSRCQ